MTSALEIVMRSSLLIGLGLLLLRLLRAEPAAFRHFVLAAVLVLAAAQPALNALLPAWQMPSLQSSRVEAIETPAGAVESEMSFEAVAPPHVAASRAANVRRAAVWVWAAGAAFSLGVLLFGLAWLTWLGSGATDAGDTWRHAVERARRDAGVWRPVRVAVTRHPALLVTWGMLAPVILLPAGAAAWPADRVQAIVAHEMAHVARRDWFIQLAAECARAVNWFNPLFWIACARLRRESEQACDDMVLDRGISRTAYASHLVDLARTFSVHGRTWLPAPSIARPSTLERRVRAMLNPQLDRRPVSRLRRAVIAAGLLAIALPIAAATQSPAGTAGTVTDPSGLALPDAAVRLAPLGGGPSIETRTDASGAFQFSSTPPGDYMLSVRYPGFSTSRERVQISGPVTFQLRMQVGTLSETVTVRGGDGAGPDASRTFTSASPAGPPACGSTSVGGNLKPPRKVKDVRPRYRQEWQQSGLEGNVLLQAHIGVDGRIRNVEVVSPNDPELEDEALAAVSQWEFSPTYLNCEPVEVRMFVTVRFTTSQQ